MRDREPTQERGWAQKFADAFRGAKRGVRGESSFFVHLFVAAAVIAAGLALDVDRLEWCLLAMCIAAVFAAEMFNSALERFSRAIDEDYNRHLADALDIGSAAVLIAAIGAAVVGVLVLGFRLRLMMGW